MTTVPVQTLADIEASTVKLAAYARHIQVCECAFWGVKDVCVNVRGCKQVWTKDQRDRVAYYLAEAQQMIEEALRFRIGYQWDSETIPVTGAYETKWGYVIAGGIKATSVIAGGTIVDNTGDPAIIGPLATTVTDDTEIHVFHTGTDYEIDPSLIVISGGLVTIHIPRCRLLLPQYADNPDTGWSYTDLSHYASTVDVVRIYNDTTDPVTFSTPSCQCGVTTSAGCLRVALSSRNSVVELRRTTSNAVCSCATRATINYYGGQPLTRQAQDAIIRLAHALMPTEPCGCAQSDQMWLRDRKVIVDAYGRPLRGMSSFGPEEGAWAAWVFVQSYMKAISLSDL